MRHFIGIDQKTDGCWMACIASLTGIELDAFPDVPHDSPEFDASAVRNQVTKLLHSRGWQLHHLWVVPDAVPRGWAIAGGVSPRGAGHAVVVYDGIMTWDPHPSRVGLTTIEDYEVLIPVREGNELPSPPDVCGWPFDSMVCVAPVGHAGPHVTSNPQYPNGLPRGGAS